MRFPNPKVALPFRRIAVFTYSLVSWSYDCQTSHGAIGVLRYHCRGGQSLHANVVSAYATRFG